MLFRSLEARDCHPPALTANNHQPPRRAAPLSPPPPPRNGGASPAHVRASPAAAAADAAFRLGFVGAGNLAESIARGVAASGVLPASAIRTAPHRRPERGAAFASLGARILASNAQVLLLHPISSSTPPFLGSKLSVIHRVLCIQATHPISYVMFFFPYCGRSSTKAT